MADGDEPLGGGMLGRQAYDMATENENLKMYVKRLQAILHDYQVSHPTAEEAAQAGTMNDAGPLPPWITQSEHVVPLLTAYDRRVQTLESALEAQHAETLELRKAAEEIVKENDGLREDLKHYMDKLLAQANGAGAGGGGAIGAVAAQEEVQSMTDQLRVVTQTNEVLSQQVGTLEQELEAGRSSMQLRDGKIVELTQELQAVHTALAQLQEEAAVLGKERSFSEARLQEQTARVVKAENETRLAKAAHGEAAANLGGAQQQLREYKASLEELTERASAETRTLVDRTRELEDRCEELRRQNAERERESHQLTQSNRTLKREHESTRADCEGMIEVIAAYEKQIADLTGREKSVSELQASSKERVQEALLERDQAQAREVQSRREIARLQDKEKNFMAELLRREQAAEGRMRTKYEAELASANDENTSINMRLAELQFEAERHQRDKRGAETELERLVSGLASEKSRMKRTMQELVDRVADAEEKRDAAELARDAAAEGLREHETSTNKELTQQASEVKSLTGRLGDAEKARAALTAERDQLKATDEMRLNELHRLKTESEMLKQEQGRRYRDLEAETTRESQELRRQLHNAKADAALATDRAAAAAQDSQAAAERAKRELSLRLSSLERRCKEGDEVARELQRQLSAKADEVNQLNRAVRDGQAVASTLEEQLQRAEELHTEADRRQRMASEQLAVELANGETQLERERKLRVDLERTRLQLQHVEQDRANLQRKLREARQGPGGGGGGGGGSFRQSRLPGFGAVSRSTIGAPGNNSMLQQGSRYGVGPTTATAGPGSFTSLLAAENDRLRQGLPPSSQPQQQRSVSTGADGSNSSEIMSGPAPQG